MFKKISIISACASLTLAWSVQEFEGFASPESVYVMKDCVFVSNLGKEVKPLEKDNDGFIIKMSKDGKMMGKIQNLNAPKGMSVAGGVLYVSDIDSIKGFDLKSQNLVFKLKIKGAVFLNDIATKDKNTLYVSDTGTGKIYSINLAKKSYEEFISLDSAKYGGGPNGLLVRGENLWVVTYDPSQKTQGQVLRISLKDKKISEFSKARGFMDGVAMNERGDLLVSAWGNNLEGVVYQISPNESYSELPIRKVKGCADIFYQDGVLYIPAMIENKVLKVTK